MKKILFVLSFSYVALVAGDYDICKSVDDKGVNIQICTSKGVISHAATVSGISQGSVNEYPLDAIEFEIRNIQPEEVARVSITFPPSHVPTALTKCKQGFPIESHARQANIPPSYICAPLTSATLNSNTNTWSYDIKEGGPLDTNSDSHKIGDPVAFQYAVSVPLSNSTKGLLALLFAFGAFFMMNRRKLA
jgi:hypothetical protein